MIKEIIQLEKVQAVKGDIHIELQNEAFKKSIRRNILSYITFKNTMDLIDLVDEMFIYTLSTEEIGSLILSMVKEKYKIDYNVRKFTDAYFDYFENVGVNSEEGEI